MERKVDMKYEEPKIEILTFMTEDYVITTSVDPELNLGTDLGTGMNWDEFLKQ